MKRCLYIVFILLTYCKPKHDQVLNTDKDFLTRKVSIEEAGYLKFQNPGDFDALNANEALISEKYNRIFIYDKQRTRIYSYSLKGKLLNTIGSKGQAPFEYSDVTDMKLDHNGRLNIFSLSDMKLNVYDLNGSYISSQKVPFYASSFEVSSDTTLIFYNNYNFSDLSGQNLIFQVNRNFEVKKKMFEIPIVPNIMVGVSGFFAKDALYQQYYFSHGMSDTIYVLDHRLNIEKTIILSEVHNMWPYGFKYSTILTKSNVLQEYSWVNNSYSLSNGLLFLQIANKGAVKTNIYNLHKNKELEFDDDLVQFLSDYIISANSQNKIFYALLDDETYSRVLNADLEKIAPITKYPQLHKILAGDTLLFGAPILYKFKISSDSLIN